MDLYIEKRLGSRLTIQNAFAPVGFSLPIPNAIYLDTKVFCVANLSSSDTLVSSFFQGI